MESGEIVGIWDYDVETKREKPWSLLSQLLADPILADVPRNPTLSDVATLVSLEKGSAMRLSIVKLDGSSLGNVLLYWHFVEHLVCIVDLHLLLFFWQMWRLWIQLLWRIWRFLFKKRVNEMEQANMGHRHISW